MRDARGYLADILKIVMDGLNATGILILTRGAGTKDATGTWNGVIGVVVRGVSLYFRAVMLVVTYGEKALRILHGNFIYTTDPAIWKVL